MLKGASEGPCRPNAVLCTAVIVELAKERQVDCNWESAWS